MIPPDVASSLRATLPDTKALAPQAQTQPVGPTQRITDVLSNLQPGQRIFAEVQGMLANGTYRATVSQREITLALPFSAKAGDSLELEVAETDGKLTLAFVANRGSATGKEDASAATSLSQTGKLIGELMQGLEGKRAAPVLLNGNQPLLSAQMTDPTQIAPALKQALTQSGVFYEAHQARWVAGQLPAEQLAKEPQMQQAPGQPGTLVSPLAQQPATPQMAQLAAQQAAQEAAKNAKSAGATAATNTIGGVPKALAPIVQQQLDGLANQQYAWQGQLWPGQAMWWEIGEEPEQRTQYDEVVPRHWMTRLKVDLPALGGVEASLRLFPGGEVGLRLKTESGQSEAQLTAAATALRQQFAAAGLQLNQLLIEHEQREER